MIIIKVDAKKAIAYFDRIVKKAPKAMGFAAEKMAKDCRKGARYRLSTRRARPSRHGNLLWQSLETVPGGKGTWIMRQNRAIADYGPIIEHGITGWHFQPKPGEGVWGEGIARRGGSIPKKGGMHFAKDAALSTLRRSKKISEPVIKDLIKGG